MSKVDHALPVASSGDASSPHLAPLPLRLLVVFYGGVSYAVGVSALVALMLIMLGVFDFTGGLPRKLGTLAALAVNALLLVGFALQHSVMARASFKANWLRVIHPATERATYVLATGLVLFPVLALWEPLPTVLWSVDDPVLGIGLRLVAVLGWIYLFVASFAINHFELFGLQQVYRFFCGRHSAPVPFTIRWMYKIDRHPIMTGLLFGMWVTPTMTIGHLEFALGFTLYILVGVYFEERALRRIWGAAYDEYCQRVGALVPFPSRRRQSPVTTPVLQNLDR